MLSTISFEYSTLEWFENSTCMAFSVDLLPSSIQLIVSSNSLRYLDIRSWHTVSKPEELPLKLLSEPCVKLSLHTAPNYLAIGIIPNFQCANSFVSLCAIFANHFIALFFDLIVLYFLITHFTRIELK